MILTASPISSAVAERNLTTFAQAVRFGTCHKSSAALRLGVDLGTANIVLAVADAFGAPVAGAWRHSSVVRDGIVIDWLGAVREVSALKAELEERIHTRFTAAAVAVPPGMDAGTVKVFTNVLSAAGLDTLEVIDEPVAAARALHVADGAVIDVGHGTTGVSILADGRVTHSMDEATGGHHLTLAIAGAMSLPYSDAEALKTSGTNADLVFGLVRPGLEKMATIAARGLRAYPEGPVFLTGGSSTLPQAVSVFEYVLDRPVYQTPQPLFVTPLGTALIGGSHE